MSERPAYVLEMSHITKEFPGVRALNDVTINVKLGEVHCLLGENGAGKSTLVKTLNGVFPAGTYTGEIRLNGTPVQFHSPHDARVKGIGFVPQEISVLDGLSVAENIFVGHWNDSGGFTVRFGDLNARAAKLLEACNIRLDPRQMVSYLSASQRQLVMIARALSTDPSVLVLDEATSSLTPDESNNLFRIVRHLQERGVTCIFITHKLREIFEMGDGVTVLRDGAVVAHFERGQFTQSDIITAMVGRRIENLYPVRDSAVGTKEVMRVENLTVPHSRITGKNIIENVSFSLRHGEILGIAGLVGSGRSEVMNAIYGRLPHTGRILMEGEPIAIRRPADAKRHGIGLLTEDRKLDGLLYNFAIRENITISSLQAFSRWGLLDRHAENDQANAYLKSLSVRAPSIGTMVSNLSGGNQQKVVLAKLLLAKPKVLLLDEPTKGVDVGAKYEIYKLMIDLVRQGVSLVVISSELPEILNMCDRFIVLAGGRVKDQFPRAEANEHRVMVAATMAD